MVEITKNLLLLIEPFRLRFQAQQAPAFQNITKESSKGT